MFLFSPNRNFIEEAWKVFYKNRYSFAHSLAGNGSVTRSAERDGPLRAVIAVRICLSYYVCEADSIIG